jgi:hypothetical protein
MPYGYRSNTIRLAGGLHATTHYDHDTPDLPSLRTIEILLQAKSLSTTQELSCRSAERSALPRHNAGGSCTVYFLIDAIMSWGRRLTSSLSVKMSTPAPQTQL